MRLLNTATHELECFEGGPPPYAILSHRWGKDEVLFRDLENGTARTKASYFKVERTCAIAAQMGIEYAWIDTCCINKSDSAELSEAINSMYHWYGESTICYVFLGDLPSTWRSSLTTTDDDEKRESTAWLLGQQALGPYDGNEFQQCEWFCRGWTLQELLAPQAVVFYNQVWEEVGTKLTLWEYITERTGIPGAILHGQGVQSATVAQRMSWAALRKTTRIEDQAYCLMGLFDVNMPLLYGERHNAFLRLQQEIIKISNDYSILASDGDNYTGSLLAPSPYFFRNMWSIQCSKESQKAITISSQGIHLSIRLDEGHEIPDQGLIVRGAWLPCTYGDPARNGQPLIIFLLEESGVYKRLHSVDLLKHIARVCRSKPQVFTDICGYQPGRVRLTQPVVLWQLTESGRIRALEALLEKGVGHSVRELMCRTAANLALARGQSDSMRVLLEKGWEGQARTNASAELLSRGLQYGNGPNVVAVVVQKGLSPDVRESVITSILRDTAEHGWRSTTEAALLALDRESARRVCIDLLEHDNRLGDRYKEGLKRVLRVLGY